MLMCHPLVKRSSGPWPTSTGLGILPCPASRRLPGLPSASAMLMSGPSFGAHHISNPDSRTAHGRLGGFLCSGLHFCSKPESAFLYQMDEPLDRICEQSFGMWTWLANVWHALGRQTVDHVRDWQGGWDIGLSMSALPGYVSCLFHQPMSEKSKGIQPMAMPTRQSPCSRVIHSAASFPESCFARVFVSFLRTGCPGIATCTGSPSNQAHDQHLYKTNTDPSLRNIMLLILILAPEALVTTVHVV